MTSRGRRAPIKNITAYLEVDGQKMSTETGDEEQIQEEKEQFTLAGIRQVITHEFGKIELQLLQFKEEIFKILKVTVQSTDTKLATIGQKID